MERTTARIEIPSDALALVGQLVNKLGGRIFKENGSEELVFVAPPIPERDRVARLLKGARLRAGLTQKQLAQRIGVPQGHVSEYEKNKRRIPAPKAALLADVLQTVEAHFRYDD